MSFLFRLIPFLLLALSYASAARADVHQPDGKLIPVTLNGQTMCEVAQTGWGSAQACLDKNEVAQGGRAGAISAVHDASIDQETFDPKCNLSFKVVQRGGGYLSVFGWYPAKPGNVPPPLGDLHVLLGCNDPVGTVRVLNVPPGTGQVGFFMANSAYACVATNAAGTLAAEPINTFYTERRFNNRDRQGNPIGGVMPNVIRVLTWQSVADPGSFYFGWEDTAFGADDDFEDLLTQVGGIECTQGGAACDTGLKGMCAQGTMQCRAGGLECVPVQQPAEEKCNAIDDNCDGVIDEGNNLCPAGFVCFRGNCVENCGRGEFVCASGTACEADAGVCVDLRCQGVSCPAGQLCRGGMCEGECLNVKCPYGQACRHGGCVDVCSGLKCDDGFTCTVVYPNGADKDPLGVCTSCSCKGCGMGFSCVSDRCVPADCASVTCPAGQHCQTGSCVDSCAGAVCPPAQKCSAGQCISDGTSGMDAGSKPDSGPPGIMVTVGTTATGSTATATGTGTSGATGSGAGGAAGGRPTREANDSSCGCRVLGNGASSREASVALLALGLCFWGRRRIVPKTP
jgi:hypothetical protein